MLNNFDNTELIESARSTGRGLKLWAELLIIVLISTIGLFATELIAAIPLLLMVGVNTEMTSIQNTVMGLYITFATTVGICAYCMLIQKRPLRSIGFTPKGAIKQYIKGLIVGFIMFGAVIAIGTFMKAFNYNGLDPKINYGYLVLLLIGFFFQGMSEEVLCRGFIMTSVARKHSVLLGVIVNTVIFALLHIFNNGISLLPLINLALFGIFTSLYMLSTGDIWGVSAIHSIWNFVQGCFYGLSVSGMEEMPSVFRFAQTEKFALNGGTFGPEGGLIVTIVLVLAITIVVLRMPMTKNYTIDVRKESENGNNQSVGEDKK